MQCGASTIVDNWNARPASELPEGYYEEETHDEDWSWVDLMFEGKAIATIDLNGDELGVLDVEKKHWPAIAIWLQRRNHENA
jgi:hypothetical protein